MMTKAKQTKKKSKEPKPSFLQEKQLFYSGSLLTDNISFIFFEIDDNFFLENKIKIVDDNISINENSLRVVFDRQTEIKTIKRGRRIFVEKLNRFLNTEIYDYLKTKYPDCVFHEISEFFGEFVNTLVMVLREDGGKPCAILKTFK